MFPFRGGLQYFIVPSLFPEQHSETFETFRNQPKKIAKFDIFERIYEFPFMPNGMFAQFVSRLKKKRRKN